MVNIMNKIYIRIIFFNITVNIQIINKMLISLNCKIVIFFIINDIFIHILFNIQFINILKYISILNIF